jgi:hypothetical protein
MEAKYKHLEMLQAIINRMARNSFMLKGWSITLVTALFALSAKDKNRAYVIIAYFPALMFWVMDGYFLWQERLFRKLYDTNRIKAEESIDFSMDTSPCLTQVGSWKNTCKSKTLKIFHGTIIVTITIVMIIM